MNLDPVETRLGRPVTDEEAAALCAVKPLLEMAGGRGYGIGWMRENTSSENANWYGFAILTGERITTCYCTTPELAADTIASLLLARLSCPLCGRRIAPEFPEPRRCLWQRLGLRWASSCTDITRATPARKDSAS